MSFAIEKLDLVEYLAGYIRTQYIEFRRTRPGDRNYTLHPKWDGGKDSDGRQHRNVWPVIAKFMLDRQFNVSACLALCFDLSVDRRYAPLPSHIAVNWKEEDYRLVSHVDEDQLRYMLESEKQLCRTELFEATGEFGMTTRDALLYVLNAESIALSPLFRFCLAASEHMDKTAEEVKLDAVLQYIIAMDGYDAAWKGWIPYEFRKRVRLAFDHSVTNRKDRHGKEESPAGKKPGRGKKAPTR